MKHFKPGINKAAVTPHVLPQPPKGPYWQNPVYQFVARNHKAASTANNPAEVQRLSALMQEISEGRMSAEKHAELEAARIASERQAKADRKKQARNDPRAFIPKEEIPSGVNISRLKERIYNPQTSPENMIKCLEMLPRAEREAVAKKLTAYLRSKIAPYLKQHRL